MGETARLPFSLPKVYNSKQIQEIKFKTKQQYYKQKQKEKQTLIKF